MSPQAAIATAATALAPQPDPWRSVELQVTPGPDLKNAPLLHRLASFPRFTRSDATLLGWLWAAPCGVPLGLFLLARFTPDSTDLSGLPPLQAIASTLLGLALLALVSWGAIVPIQRWLCTNWERKYLDAYRRLSETNLALLVVSDEHWRQAIDDVNRTSIVVLPPVKLPETPEEQLRLAVAGWAPLLRYQAGDHAGFRHGLVDALIRYRALGERLTGGDFFTRTAAQARVAAIVDFLLDPPAVLPSYRNPHRQASGFDVQAFGYDYRLRERHDRHMED
jgi:hypothetical protein